MATTAELLKAAQDENAKLREAINTSGQRSLSCKVSEKGAVSVYGLGRFPVTLYETQWEQLAAFMPTVMAFVVASKGKLASKADRKIATQAPEKTAETVTAAPATAPTLEQLQAMVAALTAAAPAKA